MITNHKLFHNEEDDNAYSGNISVSWQTQAAKEGNLAYIELKFIDKDMIRQSKIE